MLGEEMERGYKSVRLNKGPKEALKWSAS